MLKRIIEKRITKINSPVLSESSSFVKTLRIIFNVETINDIII